MQFQVQVDFIEFHFDRMEIEGSFWLAKSDSSQFDALASVRFSVGSGGGEKEIPLELFDADIEKRIKLSGVSSEAVCKRFCCRVPLVSGAVSVIRCLTATGEKLSWRVVHQGWYSPLTEVVRGSYCVRRGWFARFEGDDLVVRPEKSVNAALAELKFCWNLFLTFRPSAWRALVFRLIIAVARRFKRRDLWLVMDRFNKADDNGRVFFEYLCALPRNEDSPRYVFAIDARCPEMAELRRIGETVDAMSMRYKVLFALSDFVISAYHTQAQRLPFAEDSIAYLKPDIFKSQFVYLRHGISMNDVSKTVGKIFDNARIMNASARREYESILSGAYGYTEREVKLCGMMRFDKLYDDRKHVVTFMPTWRHSLVNRRGACRMKLAPNFTESAFFKSYSALFCHPEVVRACTEGHYELRLLLHPNLDVSRRYFESIPGLVVVPLTESYRKVFAETDLLVTDYSSVAFDFAYLKKPVLYFQFDRDEFFSTQYQKGYYDYLADGFGEVETNVESMAARIVEYLRGGAVMKPIFRQRADAFFAFTDRDNCKRMHEAILKADAEDRARG